jgi:hypothetical protein
MIGSLLKAKIHIYYRHNGKSHVIMGRVAYPLDSNAIDVKNYVTDESQIKVIENLLRRT